ncbi:MAG: GNAT family N-acetyltransferase [Cypionkella sp.]|uniref:GNAT family N-acetyltransferase n=1 Tax=Cypionkella sp. TaxID=2811411 RepID=UPI002AB8AD19|nr:GNAT family N-acetyltransferase [Cypionkella sp.]MDZ4312404.1 GNAT family N-acetyltransferase [Cypionkella sp.]
MIRPATPADLSQLCKMVHALAAYHGDTATATVANLQRDLFGPSPWLHALVFQGPRRLQGYAALTQLARVQFGQRGMDLHHLYVCTDARGDGIGKALLAASLDYARSKTASYVTVSTLPGNAIAQAFYLAQGFQPAPVAGLRYAFDLVGKP